MRGEEAAGPQWATALQCIPVSQDCGAGGDWEGQKDVHPAITSVP